MMLTTSWIALSSMLQQLPLAAWMAVAAALAALLLVWRRREAAGGVPLVLSPAGLPHLHEVTRSLDLELARARRYERPCSAVVVRPDRSASPSTPAAGTAPKPWTSDSERRLEGVATVLRRFTREVDLIAVDRVEDRFVLLFPETDHRQAAAASVRLADLLQLRAGVSAEIGVATFPADALLLDDLLSAATASCRPAHGTLAEIQALPTSNWLPARPSHREA